MKTAIDTNILFDLLVGDEGAADKARMALAEASSAGTVVVCPVVFAELAAGFSDQQEPTQFLHEIEVSVDNFSSEALFQAAVAWKKYIVRRGDATQCPQCGHTTGLRCPACQATLAWRQHIITGFLVGGHALSQSDRLLTRDRGYYHTYFPELRIETP